MAAFQVVVSSFPRSANQGVQVVVVKESANQGAHGEYRDWIPLIDLLKMRERML